MDYSKSKFEEGSEDIFDKLPDDILHLIFNKVHDAKSLCNSLSVSKRFHFLIAGIDTLSLTLPRCCTSINTSLCLSSNKNEHVNSDQDSKPKKHFLDRVLNKLFLNPLKRLLQIATQKSSRSHCECKDEENTFDLVSQVLKNFEGVKSLHVELPGHGGESSGPSNNNSNNLLKWKAEFGEKLESCVIFGATSSSFRISNKEESALQEQGSTSFISEEELKERVVWIVSSLMAASARHYMVGEVVKANREVEKVVITDGSKQGRICFDKRQVGDLRDIGIEPGTELLERSRVPKLRMKLWYVPELEVEGGLLMKGATLVVIRPLIEGEKRRARGSMSSSSDGDLVKGAFGDQEEKVFGEAAVKMVMKKKTYTLEMNSF